MTADFEAGLVQENLVMTSDPLIVQPGREEAVVAPYEDAEIDVARISSKEFSTSAEFLIALHERLPLPFGGLRNWDAVHSCYDEIADTWPQVSLIVVADFDRLVHDNLWLAMTISRELVNTAYELAERGCRMTPVFVLGEDSSWMPPPAPTRDG